MHALEKNKTESLAGKVFRHQGKPYRCDRVVIKNQKHVIFTHSRTFVQTPTEYQDFLDEIEIEVNPLKIIKMSNEIQAVLEPKKDEVIQSAIKAEIIQNSSINKRITDKLMTVFDLLSEAADEKTIKQADAMVRVSNSIVAVQMSQIKALHLKNSL